jgi:YVTN family beta-propeller protein
MLTYFGISSTAISNLASLPMYLMFLVGGALLLLKRKIGVFVSLAGIAYLYIYGAYSWTLPPFNELNTIDKFTESWYDFTDPFGIPSTAVVVALLIIGWRKVQWITSAPNDSPELAGDAAITRQNHSTARALFFTALPIISVVLLYFIYVGDIRAGLRAVEGECNADNPNVSQISLGKVPNSGSLYGIAANHITNKIYAPHTGNGTVAVIDGDSNELIKTIDLGIGTSSLDGVAVNTATNKIYVANSGNPTSLLFVINGTNDAVVKSIPVGTYAIGVAIDTSLNRIYVASNGDNSVSVIDGQTDEKISTIYIPIGPRFVSANENDHKVYVTGLDSSKVAVFNGSSSDPDWNMSMIDVAGKATAAGGAVMVNPVTDKVYVSSVSGIVVINSSSNKIVHTIDLEGFNAAFQYAVNPVANEVYAGISNTSPAKLLVIDGTSDIIKKKITVGNSLFGIATNPRTGSVYAVDSYAAKVYVVNKTTSCS